MRITKSKLKQIIKEELESLFTDPATLGTGARLARPGPPPAGDEFRASPDYEHPTTEAGQEFLRWGVPYADVMRLDYEMNPMHYWAKEKESDWHNRYPETKEGMRTTGGYAIDSPEAAHYRSIKESYKKIIKEELDDMLNEQDMTHKQSHPDPLLMKRARAKRYVRQALDPLEYVLDPHTALRKRVMKIYRSACKGGDQDACTDLKKALPKYRDVAPPSGIEGFPDPTPPKY